MWRRYAPWAADLLLRSAECGVRNGGLGYMTRGGGGAGENCRGLLHGAHGFKDIDENLGDSEEVFVEGEDT